MVLRSTQSLTEMSTRNILGGKGRPARKADNLTAICEPIVWILWDPQRPTTLWASMASYGNRFTFYLTISLQFTILSTEYIVITSHASAG
jgi:hypothetical protein